MSNRSVVVLGASVKPQRYSNKAIRLLVQYGYNVIPVHPKIQEVEGLRVVSDLESIKTKVHTITLYLGLQRSSPLIQKIIDVNPKRVIFNPGSENDELQSRLQQSHIECIHDCSLVMLNEGRF